MYRLDQEQPSREAAVARQDIQAFLIDDENLDEFAAHGVSDEQVLEILDDELYMGRNKQGRPGSHLIIG